MMSESVSLRLLLDKGLDKTYVELPTKEIALKVKLGDAVTVDHHAERVVAPQR